MKLQLTACLTFIALVDILGAVGAVEAGRAAAGVAAGDGVRVAAGPRVARVAGARVLQVAQQTGLA